MHPVSIRTLLSTGLHVLVLGLALATTSGCTFNYPVKQEVLPQPTTEALVQPWPLSVGLSFRRR